MAKKEEPILPNYFALRPRLELYGAKLRLHIVNYTGTHKDPYWLLEMSQTGIKLIEGVDTKPGFELATGQHIRAIISDGKVNTELEMPEENFPSEEQTQESLASTEAEKAMSESSMQLAAYSAKILDKAITKTITKPEVVPPDPEIIAKLVKEWNDKQENTTTAELTPSGKVVIKEDDNENTLPPLDIK